MTIEQAQAKRWTDPEARAKQAAKIKDWQPWNNPQARKQNKVGIA